MDVGANSDTQWYWPPAVGAMDAISAKDAIIAMMNAHVMTVIQITPAVPPLKRPKYAELSQLVQVLRFRVMEASQQRTFPCGLKDRDKTNNRDQAEVSLEGNVAL